MSTPDPADFLRDFLHGWAQYLADAELGITWPPPDPGVYQPADVGIGMLTFPTDLDTAVALTPVPFSDDATQTQTVINLQVKCRAKDRFACMRLNSAINSKVAGLFPYTLSTGIHIVSMDDSSSTPLGQDGNDRFIWSSNYPMTAHRPTANRL